MDAVLTFLTCYSEKGNEFLESIMTGDEMGVFHPRPEGKQQLMEWHDTHSPMKKEFKTSAST
jgi:hypothetical protein